MTARSSTLLWLVCALACPGPTVSDDAGTTGTTMPATSTTTSAVTSTTTSASTGEAADPTTGTTTDPTGAVMKFDLPLADLSSSPPLECDGDPDVRPETECTVGQVEWPSEPGYWFEFVYACTLGDKPDVCPAADSVEATTLLEECDYCSIVGFVTAICGPDPKRPDACCYWAIVELDSCRR